MSTLITSTLSSNYSTITTAILSVPSASSSILNSTATSSTTTTSASKNVSGILASVLPSIWFILLAAAFVVACAIIFPFIWAFVTTKGIGSLLRIPLIVVGPLWAPFHIIWKIWGSKMTKVFVDTGKWVVGLWKSMAKTVVRLGDRTRMREMESKFRVENGKSNGKDKKVGDGKVSSNSGNGPQSGVLESENLELEVLQ